MKLFSKAKHWQVFLLTFGLPFVFSLPFLFTIVNDPNLDNVLSIVKYLPFGMFVLYVLYIGWFWELGVDFQYKIPTNARMGLLKFKIALFLPIVYLIFLAGFILYSFSGSQLPDPISLLAIVAPLHTLAMCCVSYVLYFVAKTIKTVELQREVSFKEFAAEFFMIPLYPVTIWIFQPKINELADLK